MGIGCPPAEPVWRPAFSHGSGGERPGQVGSACLKGAPATPDVLQIEEFFVASPFTGLEVEEEHRPSDRAFGFDLDRCLSSVLVLEAHVADDAFTAETLGTERVGNAVVLNSDGLVLTIGYLIMEA